MQQRGFTLVELITVMVLVAVLGSTVGSRFMSNSLLQIQGGRDQLVAAFFIAQQKAMAQVNPVQLLTFANTIDIRVDSNNDGSFSSSESIVHAGTRYPLSVGGGVSFSNAIFNFDRKGFTAAGSVDVSKKTASVAVTVSGTGYAY